MAWGAGRAGATQQAQSAKAPCPPAGRLRTMVVHAERGLQKQNSNKKLHRNRPRPATPFFAPAVWINGGGD